MASSSADRHEATSSLLEMGTSQPRSSVTSTPTDALMNTESTCPGSHSPDMAASVPWSDDTPSTYANVEEDISMARAKKTIASSAASWPPSSRRTSPDTDPHLDHDREPLPVDCIHQPRCG